MKKFLTVVLFCITAAFSAQALSLRDISLGDSTPLNKLLFEWCGLYCMEFSYEDGFGNYFKETIFYRVETGEKDLPVIKQDTSFQQIVLTPTWKENPPCLMERKAKKKKAI